MSDDLPEELRAVKEGEIERIQREFHEKQSQSRKDSQNSSQAGNSKITSPEEDERVKQKKLAVLNQVVADEVSKAIMPINLQIQQIPNIIQETIQSMIGQAQQNAVVPNQGPSMPVGLPEGGSKPGIANLAQMDPQLFTGLAQILQTILGRNGNPAPDPYAEMFKQIGVNIMQAGVDGIYKNVYEGYKPTPPTKAFNPQTTSQEQGTSTGFV